MFQLHDRIASGRPQRIQMTAIRASTATSSPCQFYLGIQPSKHGFPQNTLKRTWCSHRERLGNTLQSAQPRHPVAPGEALLISQRWCYSPSSLPWPWRLWLPGGSTWWERWGGVVARGGGGALTLWVPTAKLQSPTPFLTKDSPWFCYLHFNSPCFYGWPRTAPWNQHWMRNFLYQIYNIIVLRDFKNKFKCIK